MLPELTAAQIKNKYYTTMRQTHTDASMSESSRSSDVEQSHRAKQVPDVKIPKVPLLVQQPVQQPVFKQEQKKQSEEWINFNVFDTPEFLDFDLEFK